MNCTTGTNVITTESKVYTPTDHIIAGIKLQRWESGGDLGK